MLILSRKVGESLMIGDDVVVTVLEVRNGQIRVGINAPREVDVHREEVFERIAAKKAVSAPQVAPALPPVRRVACKPQHRARLTLKTAGQHL